MDKKTIEAIQGRIEDDKDFQDNLASYHKIMNMDWELPANWRAKQWVRKQVSTDGFDAVKMAQNIYDASSPKWEVLPMGLAEKDRAERYETALEWWMKRANKLGGSEPLRKALHNSCLQNRVIYQMDYLPYWLSRNKQDWSKEQKEAMKKSSFCITNHDARNVYYEMGKYGLKWAAAVTVVSAEDISEHWSVYSAEDYKDLGNGYAEVPKTANKIKSALSKIKNMADENSEQLFILVDYTSHKKREVSAFPTSSETLAVFKDYDENSERIDILDEENKLGFINWVIVEGEGTPLLFSIHRSGAWENQNLYNTLVDSTVMRRAVFPILQHTSPTGKPLDVDYEGEQDVIEQTTGETTQVLVPPPIDAALTQLANTNIARISQTTGMKGLSSIEIAGNVQYAAVQAVVQLHMTNLQPYVRTVEKANSQLGDLCFQWIKTAETTELYWRDRKKGEGALDRGVGGSISYDDFDPEDVIIECRLIAAAPTDKQQLFNMYAQLKQAGAHISWKHIVDDKLNIGNGDVLEAEWVEEEAGNAAIQMKVKELDAALQMKVKELDAALQMKLQAATQPSQPGQVPPGQVPPDQSDPMMPEGQGYNAAGGGQPTAPAVPGATSPVQP